MQLSLPEVPDFPDTLDFSLPPIPRLIPTWQTLQSLSTPEGGLYAKREVEGSNPEAQQDINLDYAMLGLGAGLVVVVGAILSTRSRLRSVRMQLRRSTRHPAMEKLPPLVFK